MISPKCERCNEYEAEQKRIDAYTDGYIKGKQARTEEIIKTIFTNLKHIFTYVDKDGRTAIYSREVQKLREEVEEKFLSGKEKEE